MRRTSRDYVSDPYNEPRQPTFRTSYVGPLRRIVESGGLAVSVGQAKTHAYIEHGDDDVHLERTLGAAQRLCERLVNGRRQFLPATYDLPVMGFWEGALKLPRPPLQSVSGIYYYDTNGTEQTLTSTIYLTDAAGLDQPGTVERAPDQSWPAVQDDRRFPVRIRFIAGYLAPVTAAVTDTLTSTGRAFNDNDRGRFWHAGGVSAALPAGLQSEKDYWVRDASSQTFKVAEVPGGSAVDVTGTGTGLFYFGLIPEVFQEAVLKVTAYWYAHREAALRNEVTKEIELGVCDLLGSLDYGSYS